jgi:hypothetical protein
METHVSNSLMPKNLRRVGIVTLNIFNRRFISALVAVLESALDAEVKKDAFKPRVH